MVELKGPNASFVGKMLKHGGDVKVGGEKKVELESVNHDDAMGRKKLADTNPGADKQNHEVHGEKPAELGKLSGIHQPKIGGSDESVEKEIKLNRPPRAFKYSREGHSMENEK